MKVILSIPDIRCGNCVNTIQRLIERLYNEEKDAGTLSVSGSAQDKEMVILAKNITINTLLAEIEDIGFSASLIAKEEECAKDAVYEAILAERRDKLKAKALREEEKKRDKQKAQNGHLRASLSLLIPGISLLLLSAFAISVPFFWMLPIGIVSSATCFYSCWDMYAKSMKKFYKSGSLSMDFLFSISTLSAIGLSFYAFFNPMVSFEFHSALLILASKRIGQYFETRLEERVDSNTLFTDDIPKKVAKLNVNSLDLGLSQATLTPIDEIKAGDKIRVYPGEYIPVDAKVIGGNARILTTIYNGESESKAAKVGQSVLAGMRVDSGTLYIEAHKPFMQSYVADVEHTLIGMQGKKSRLEGVADKVMRHFIPMLLVLTVTCGVMTASFMGPIMGIHTALAMLVAACPCVLGFIVPLAVKLAAKRVAKEGVILNHPEALEKAEKVKAIAFDVNGTLTESQSCLRAYKPLKPENHDKFRDVIYALENKAFVASAHPVAKTLKDAMLRLGASDSFNIRDFQLAPGGVIGTIDDETYYLGNRPFMKTQGFEDEAKVSAGHILYLASKREGMCAQLSLEFPLKEGACQALEMLAQMGYPCFIVTGAYQKDVQHVLDAIHFPKDHIFCGQQGAEAKAKTLALLEKRYGDIAMVGDGGNDILALTSSKLGISFDDGDNKVKSQADFIIRNQQMRAIPALFTLSKKSVNVMKRSLIASLVYNVFALMGTCCFAFLIGAMSPAIMAALMGAQSIAILFYVSKIKHMKSGVDIRKMPMTTETEDVIGKMASNTQRYSSCCDKTLSNSHNLVKNTAVITAKHKEGVLAERTRVTPMIHEVTVTSNRMN